MPWKEQKKRKLTRALYLQAFFFFFTSDQAAALSQAEEANDCQKPNVTANVASQEVASVSEGVSTTREEEKVDGRENTVLMHLRERIVFVGRAFFTDMKGAVWTIFKYRKTKPCFHWTRRWVTSQLNPSGQVMWNKDLGADKENV